MEYQVPLYRVHCPSGVGAMLEEHLRSGKVANGPGVPSFERALGDYLGNPYVNVTSDVSASLVLSLFMAGVRPGTEVIASPMACLATNIPVLNLFAKVRWCDIDPYSGSISPEALKRCINANTKATLLYHWAGNPIDLEPIYAIARENHLPVIEDAGEALGAEYQGQKIGNTGADYTVFSFYPNRHVTTGEGGAIAFASEENRERGRWLRRYGIHQPSFRTEDGEINPSSDISEPGWNVYMNNLEASLGLAQMNYLPALVAAHQVNGLYYDEVLCQVSGVRTLSRPADSRSAYWVYSLLVERPLDFIRKLRTHGIQASRVHVRTDRYTCFGPFEDNLPGVTEFENNCVSIPCGWWVTPEDREYVARCIRGGW